MSTENNLPLNPSPPPTRVLLPLALYLLSAILLTWPLVTRFTTALPLGSESTATVPQFNLWTLQLNQEKIRQGFGSYWDAPIFYPGEGAFAFSDPQPAAGLLAFLFSAGTPAAGYNAVLLLYLALNGFVAYCLFRHLSMSKPVALLGGFWAQMLPFLAHERGVLLLQPFFLVVLVLIAALKLGRSPTARRAGLLGLTLGGSFFFSEYYGIIAGLVTAIFLARAAIRSRRVVIFSLLAFVLAAAMALPFLLQQRQILAGYGFSRSLSSVEAGSAHVRDYLRPSQRTLWSQLIGIPRARFGLYPGLGLSLLALFSLTRFSSPPAGQNPKPAFIASAALAFFLSLGLHLTIFGVQPYRWLWQSLPGLAHMRSPFRFAVLLQFALLVLALFVIEQIWRKRRYLLLAALVILVTLEILPLPEKMSAVPPNETLEGVPSPAVFLPFVSGTSASAYYQTTSWMLVAQRSSLAIVNGYSGYFPAAHSRDKSALENFPDPDGLEFLAQRGVRAIIVHTAWLEGEREALTKEWVAQGLLAPMGEQFGFSIFVLP